MLARFKNRSGNRYTLVSIIIIIAMLYFFKLAMGKTGGEYPETIYFNDHKYTYSQTIKASSFKFVRNYGKNYSGYVLLTTRSEKGNTAPEAVYIFEGWKSYREYELEKSGMKPQNY